MIINRTWTTIIEFLILIVMVIILFTLITHLQEFQEFGSPCRYCENKTGAVCAFPDGIGIEINNSEIDWRGVYNQSNERGYDNNGKN